MLSFEEFIIACEDDTPKYDEERRDKIAELTDKYNQMKEEDQNLTKEFLELTKKGVVDPPPEVQSRMDKIHAEQQRLRQEMEKTNQEIDRLSNLKLEKTPDEFYKDPETHEGINNRLKQIDTELSSLDSVNRENLTSTQIRQKERLHEERARLFKKKLESQPEPNEAKVGKKASILKKTGKYGLGVAAVGGLAYGGYKLLHKKKDSSNESMLSFEEFVIALENEDEYKEKPNYLKWGLGATAAAGAAGLLALVGSSKAKSVEKAFSSAKKDSKFKDSFRKRESEFTHHTPDKKEENVKKTASASPPSEKIEHKGHKTIVMYRVSRRWWSEHHPDLNKLANKIHHGSSEDTSQGAILPTIARMTEKKPDSNEWRPWKEISLDEVKKWNDPDTTFWVRYDYDDPDKKILKELDEHKAMSNAEHDHLRQVLYEYAHGERGKPVSVKYYRVLKGKDK